MNSERGSPTPKGRGRGFFRHEQDHKELRRPQAEKRTDLAASSNNAEPGPVAEGNISKTKPLSVDAKEFFPKNYPSQQLEDSEDSYSCSLQFEEVPHEHMLPFQLPFFPSWSLGHRNLHDRLCNIWSPMNSCSVIKVCQAGPEAGGCSYYNSFNPLCENKEDECATNHFVELMQHLTLNPGKFDDLITPLIETFKLWLEDGDTVSSIVNAIVEQSIMEPNFRYNGARLCHFLDSECPAEDRTFRNFLLNRCKEEHMQISKYFSADPERLHGYVLFMAELFMQLECVKDSGERIEILGKALLEALSLLLNHPTSGNIKCVCQVLKLTGQPLDVQDPVNMEKVMECLIHILNNLGPESNVRRLISSVIELRHVGWGDTSNCMPHTSTSQLCNPCLPNGPVFYGPDGQIMTPEERQFLQESVGRIPDHEEYDDYSDVVDSVWEPEDEMDEEMHAAFEEFLEMGKTQSKDSDSTHSGCSG